jgi:hypothetical protein
MGRCSSMEPLNPKLWTHSQGAGWSSHSTAELTGDCFTQCLASFMKDFFNAQQSLSVIKHGLPSHSFIVGVLSRFHFTIPSPTADLGNLKRFAMSVTDFLLMWQPITSSRLKSLCSRDLPILLVLLSNEQHTALCDILYQ